MTDEERRLVRKERRINHRMSKKTAFTNPYDNFNKVFSIEHLFESARKCKSNVMWKSSVQGFSLNLPLKVVEIYNALQNGTFKTGHFYEFDIMERGKHRHIRSVTFEERVVQRCLCDYSLVPMLSRSFIYDNGASIKNKGVFFSQKRLVEHLCGYYRENGPNGYILLFDFHHFFDSVQHEYLFNIVDNLYIDKRISQLVKKLVSDFGDIGLGLGSQVSQIFALASANKLDHFIKEQLKVKYYARYMDDGYIIHKDKQHLYNCLLQIQKECAKYGFELNIRKTQIVKLSHQFIFLKTNIFMTKNGHVHKKIYHSSVVRMRRKLIKWQKSVKDKRMTANDVYQSYQSWRSHWAKMDNHKTVYNMQKLFTRLYPKYIIKKEQG